MIKKLFFGGTASLIFIFVSICVNIIRSALAIRYLPTIESGVWFLFLNVITFLSFCDFGLSPTLSREIGFSYKKQDPSLRISNLFVTTRRLTNFLSLVVLLLAVTGGYFYFHSLPLDLDHKKNIFIAFSLFNLGMVMQFRTNPYLAALYGIGEIAIERHTRSFGLVCGAVMSCLLVGKFGLFGLVFGYISQALFTYLLAIFLQKKKIQILKHATFFKLIVKRIAKPALQWTVMGIGAILIFQISNFIIGYLMGVKHIPQFAILLQILGMIIMFSSMISYVLTPFVSRASGENKRETVQYLLSISVRASTAIAIVLAVFLFVFIKPITKIWLGGSFLIDKKSLLILLSSAVLEAHHVSCAAIAMASGYVKFSLIAILSGVCNLVLSFILIKRFGPFGAALAIFISQILTNNWYAVYMSLKYIHYGFLRYLRNIAFPLAVFFCGFWPLVEFVKRIPAISIENIGTYTNLIVSAFIIGLSAMFLTWITLLSNTEKMYLKKIFFENKNNG